MRICVVRKPTLTTASRSSLRNARSYARWCRPCAWREMVTSSYIGRPQNRVDGRAKVTGEAKYAAEYNVPGLVHGCIVGATIARGEIGRIVVEHALQLPGVLCVLTHENRERLRAYEADGEHSFLPLRDSKVHFSGQPIALVVAETLE